MVPLAASIRKRNFFNFEQVLAQADSVTTIQVQPKGKESAPGERCVCDSDAH